MLPNVEFSPLIYKNNGLLSTSTQDFHHLTGAEWITCMKMVAEPPFNAYDPTKDEIELMQYLTPRYTLYQRNPPRLYIRESQKLGRHSLHTVDSIPAGTIITEYLGEWDTTHVKPSAYRWGPIDGLRYRNFGAMAEDGFPNIGAFHLYGVDNIPLRIVFVALDNLAPNEMLTINYGMRHSVKVQYHEEYALDKMRAFFMVNPLEMCFSKIQQLQTKKEEGLSWNARIELESYLAKIQYIYNTPSALIPLFVKQVLKPTSVFSAYHQPNIRHALLGVPLKPDLRQAEVIDYLSLLKTYVERYPAMPDFKEEWIDQIRVRLLFAYLQSILQNPNETALLKQETILSNSFFDAIQAEDVASIMKLRKQLTNPATFQEWVFYAQQINSPIAHLLSQVNNQQK